MYNALILPHISYCVHIWGTTASVHLHRLHVLQKKIVRIIFGVHPRTHTEPLYRVLHVLNVDQIRDYSIALFMYKLTKCMLPSMFENMFISTSDVHNYSTRQADLLYVQYASTKRTQRTIKHFGTKLWNSLCNDIDIDCAISSFEHRMKIFLLTWSLPFPYFILILSLVCFIIIFLIFVYVLSSLSVFSFVCLYVCMGFFVCVFLFFFTPLALCTLFPVHHIYKFATHMNLGHVSLHVMPSLSKLLYHCACLLMLSFMLCHDLAWLIPLSE